MDLVSDKLRTLLGNSRKVSLCLDGWSKKGLTASYLGVSACFFNSSARQPVHALLDLIQLDHPHTGEKISAHLMKCCTDYNIDVQKVFHIITDNGANMVKACNLWKKEAQEQPAESNNISLETVEDTDDESEVDENGSSFSEDADEIPLDSIIIKTKPTQYRLSCLAHSLQLVAKVVYKEESFEPVISAARKIASQIRKSSVMTEKLIQQAGKTLSMDCSTRWNSTFAMLNRLRELKQYLNTILAESKIDTLLVSEWMKVDEICNFLEPFASLTDVMQSDTLSLSSVIPCLMNLEIHLQTIESNRTLAEVSFFRNIVLLVYQYYNEYRITIL